MEGGGGKIIEDLDSFWFFSNVLCSSKPPLPSLSTDHEKINSSHPSESPKSNLQEEPMFPNFEESKEVLVSDEQDQIQTVSELSFELQDVEPVVMEAIESPELVKKEQQRSRTGRSNKNRGFTRRRTKGEQKEQQKFRNFGFVSGFYGGFEGGFVPVVPSFQSSGDPYLVFKIPPLNDGMAMKEHLRSWAHAVACTVR